MTTFVLIIFNEKLSRTILIETLFKGENLSCLCLLRYIDMDTVEFLKATRSILAFKALNLRATLTTENLIDRRLGLISHYKAHSRFFKLLRFKEAGIGEAPEKFN